MPIRRSDDVSQGSSVAAPSPTLASEVHPIQTPSPDVLETRSSYHIASAPEISNSRMEGTLPAASRRHDDRPKRAPRREVGFDGNLIANHANEDEVQNMVRGQRGDVFVREFDGNGVTLDTAQLDTDLLHNIRHLQKYTELLPLQERCIEILLDARKPDMLVQSPTGSGKTAAFGIPAVQIAKKHKERAGPSVIIVCNTMNLALQIRDHLRSFAGQMGHYGKSSTFPQPTGVRVFGMFKNGDDRFNLSPNSQPDIVVATMGMLLDTINRKKLLLENLHLFVADEADKMVKEGGFLREVREFLGMVPKAVKGRMQVAAFSATFSNFEDQYGDIDLNAEELSVLFYKRDKEPAIVKVEGIKGYITQRLILIKPSNPYCPSDIATSRQAQMELARNSVTSTYFSRKLGYLCALLENDKHNYYKDGKFEKTTVVFVERITTSNFLATYLIMKGYKVAPLNSNYDLPSVNQTIKNLVNGEIQAVISTNKLARGQDIPDLHHVIVFEMSSDFDDYKHRIGRTGRIGKGGVSTALLTELDQKHFYNLFSFLLEHDQTIPEWLAEYAQQLQQQMEMYHNESDTLTENIC